jgi:hypothetical protein
MIRQMKSKLLPVTLAVVLMGLALPTFAAAEVKVNVLAAEYNNNLLVVSVVAFATEGEDPTNWDVSLLRGGTPPVALAVQREEELTFPRAKLWKLVVHGNVVSNGDILTAVVSEDGAALGSDNATCGAGLPRLRITAVCK